ncbi:MAG: FAD-binding oxidoreductase [Hespellia sp.]|nr:FAD-binding oxidoreductase [Hespellia sp.]
MEAKIRPLGNEDADYLQDESGFEGIAYSISFPQNRNEVKDIIDQCMGNHETITIQGALTGITGAGVPLEGHVMNMKEMNHILEITKDCGFVMKVEPGITFGELEGIVRKESNNTYFLPVVPTEKSATLGGAVSSGSKGIQSYHYGSLENYIEAIEICDNQGTFVTIEKKAENNLLIGSEGMLGAITAITLRLVKKPKYLWGIVFMFPEDETACAFADSIHEMEQVMAVEYMDRKTIELIDTYKNSMTQISKVPSIPAEVNSLLYIEIAGDEEEIVEEAAAVLIEKCVETGGDPDTAWAVTGETEVENIRNYRHAASECTNMKIAESHGSNKRIKKLSADIEWKNRSRAEILKYYNGKLENSGLNYCIFGHLGTKQPYVNILANNQEEYEQGKMIMSQFIRDAYIDGGMVFKEHGIGKLKKGYFCELAPIEEINKMVKLKGKWDAKSVFNVGNMFSENQL